LFSSGGGIISSSSLDVMRNMSSLSCGLPGTIAGSSDLPPFSAASRWSSRRPCLDLSGPWHLKQLFAKIGRTSRENSGGAAAGAPNIPAGDMSISE
jgi:hypothetical protein